MPTSIKRKRAGANTATSSKVNAAPTLGPGSGSDSAEIVPGPVRPDLLSALKDQFGPMPATGGGVKGSAKGGSDAIKSKKDDYEKFVEEMGDILGP